MPIGKETTKRRMVFLNHELKGNDGQFDDPMKEQMQSELDFLEEFYTKEGELKEQPTESAIRAGKKGSN